MREGIRKDSGRQNSKTMADRSKRQCKTQEQDDSR